MLVSRFDRVLGALTVSGLVILGIGEVITRVDEPTPLLFWLPTLWGGAASILIGGFVMTRNIRVSKALVIAGCALGFLPSFWTMVMPVLLLVLVIRTLIGTRPVETSSQM